MVKKLIRKYWLLRGRCPNCKEKSIGYGQWNDGIFFGKPFCFNDRCPEPAKKELHDWWELSFDKKYPKEKN